MNFDNYECEGQMTIGDYIRSKFYDHDGRVRSAPEWVKEERCGNCRFWQILPEYDQPPNGWGTRGLCGSHVSKNQYTTAQTSYCQEFEWRNL